MSLKKYGVLKGRPIARKLGAGSSPHYQVHMVDEATEYRIAVNVKSKLAPSELEYVVVDNLVHPLTDDLLGLPLGFNEIDSAPGGMALDYIRGNLFDRDSMRKLPHNVPGPDNDLNEKIDALINRAIADEEAALYAFGERWGPEPTTRDKHFGFLPGNGIHDIHMNQGNDPGFRSQDGVWQDGGMLVHFPATDGVPEQWAGVFLKFQSQAWHTDDATGHTITGTPDDPDDGDVVTEQQGNVRIVAALPNPAGSAPEHETVTILNTTPNDINLTGWQIADKNKNKDPLDGTIGAGQVKVVTLSQTTQLSNKGGLITLLNAEGLKVDGVSYTKTQASREGWTIVF